MSEKLNKKGLERLWHKILLLADCIYGKISALEKSMPEQAKNGKLTIQKNGTTVETFTANQSGDTTANIVIPNVINSCAVTQKGQMALDAIEKNATIEGTLAHQIAQANSNLNYTIDNYDPAFITFVDNYVLRTGTGIHIFYCVVNINNIPDGTPLFSVSDNKSGFLTLILPHLGKAYPINVHAGTAKAWGTIDVVASYCVLCGILF